MRVNAWTENKEVVPIQLAPEQVAAAGIEPWRMDLFDPFAVSLASIGLKASPIEPAVFKIMDSEPITIEPSILASLDARNLRVNRLRPFALAYRDQSGTYYAGLYDGEKGVCVTGVSDFIHFDDHCALRLKNVRQSNRPFHEHLCEYFYSLSRLSNWGTSDDAIGDNWRGFPPHSMEELVMRGSQVFFKMTDYSFFEPISYAGRTLQLLHVPMVLPDEINMLFELLAKCKPVVFGSSLRSVITSSEQPQQVDILIARGLIADALSLAQANLGSEAFTDGLTESERLTKAEMNWQFTFHWHGWSFRCMQRPSPVVEIFRHDRGYSADCIYAERQNEIIGSRIALFDLGKKQARRAYLDQGSGWEPGGLLQYSTKLEEDGFRICL